jgi:hypothetical protein
MTPEMIDEFRYTALLRPIGQMLEGLRIESFSVKPDSVGFVVRDKTRNRAQLTPREKAFLGELHWMHEASLNKEDALQLAAGIFEWHVTSIDLERFEAAGRARRHQDSGTPDSHSISQILRVIGNILDQKRQQLYCISKDANAVAVEYLSGDGKVANDEYSLPMLYDQWVRMYKRRANPQAGEQSLT